MPELPPVRIGTRGSKLALWQANFLSEELERHGRLSTQTIIKTQGDRVQDLSFDKLEGKGFFTKELEEALLSEEVDVAVHSMKDLPTVGPEGLVLAGVSARANAHDWLLVRGDCTIEGRPWRLADDGLVGTSSVRRKAQLLDLRPGLTVRDLRGNVPTRIRKLREGQYDAIVLAAAGIERLGLDLSDLHVSELHAREFVPAPAQGVLAYQCRESDTGTRRLLARLHHRQTAACTNVERALLRSFDGGCQLPLGAHCTHDARGYHLVAAYAPTPDAPLRRARLSYNTFDGLATDMLARLRGEGKLGV